MDSIENVISERRPLTDVDLPSTRLNSPSKAGSAKQTDGQSRTDRNDIDENHSNSFPVTDEDHAQTTFKLPDKDTSPFHILQSLLSDHVISSVLEETNNFAAKNTHEKPWRRLDKREFWRFLSLNFIEGIDEPNLAKRTFWTARLTSTPNFSQVVSRQRYQQILSNLNFRKPSNLPEGQNPLFKLGNVTKEIFQTNMNVINPGKNLVLTESHQLFKGSSVKFLLLVDCDTKFIVKAKPYLTNPSSKTESLDKDIILNFLKGVSLQHRRVVAGPSFASPKLAKKLLKKNIFFLGTASKKHLQKFNSLEGTTADGYYVIVEDNVIMERHDEGERKLLIRTEMAHNIKSGSVTPSNNSALVEFEELIRDTNVESILLSHTIEKESMKLHKKIFFQLVDFCLFNAFVIFHSFHRTEKCTFKEFIMGVVEEILVEFPKHAMEIRQNSQQLRMNGNVPHFPQVNANHSKCFVCRNHTNVSCISCKKMLCVKGKNCFNEFHTNEHEFQHPPTKAIKLDPSIMETPIPGTTCT